MREVERVSVGINGQHCIVDIQVQTIKQVVVLLAKEGGRSVLLVLWRVSGSYWQW